MGNGTDIQFVGMGGCGLYKEYKMTREDLLAAKYTLLREGIAATLVIAKHLDSTNAGGGELNSEGQGYITAILTEVLAQDAELTMDNSPDSLVEDASEFKKL